MKAPRALRLVSLRALLSLILVGGALLLAAGSGSGAGSAGLVGVAPALDEPIVGGEPAASADPTRETAAQTDGTAAAQIQPGRPPRPPRHKPGYRSKSFASSLGTAAPGPLTAPAVNQLLATGTYTNPLQGNYVIMPQQQLAVLNAYASESSQAYTSTQFSGFDVNLNPITSGSPYTASIIQGGTWPIALSGAAADVNADYVDELVSVWNANQGTSNAPCLAPLVLSLASNLSVTAAVGGTPCQTNVKAATESSTSVPYQQAAVLAAGSFYNGAAAGQGKQVAMAWNGKNGSSDAVCVGIWDNAVGSLQLTFRGSDCSANSPMLSDPTGVGKSIAPPVALAAGDLNGDGYDELVLAWVESGGQAIAINLYTVSPSGVPQVSASTKIGQNQGWPSNWCAILNSPPCYYYSVSVALGDFTGAGVDSIALSTQMAVGVLLYTLSASSDLTKLSFGNSGSGHASAQANIWDSNLAPYGPHWQSGPQLVAAPFVYQPVTALPAPPVKDYLAIVWPYDADQYSNMHMAIDFYTFSNSLSPSSLTPGGYQTGKGESFNGSASPPEPYLISAAAIWSWPSVTAPRLAITITGPKASTTEVTLWELSVDSKGNGSVKQVGSSPSFSKTLNWGGIGLISGDFAGQSTRAVPISVTGVPGLVTINGVLQRPPTHIDVFPDIGAPNAVTVNVNDVDTSNCTPYAWNNCPAISFASSQQNSTTQGLTIKNSWSFSDQLTLGNTDEALNASLSYTYGQNFENSTTNSQTTTTQQGVYAIPDDYVFFNETDTTLWEYALYQGSATQPTGYMTIAFPNLLPCATGSGYCAGTTNATGGSGGSLNWYIPQVEPANILSYPPRPAATTPISQAVPDMQTNLVGGKLPGVLTEQLGGDSWTEQIGYSAGTTSSQSTTTSQSAQAQASFGLTNIWANQLKGSYQNDRISTQQTTYSQSTSIFFNMPGLANCCYAAGPLCSSLCPIAGSSTALLSAIGVPGAGASPAAGAPRPTLGLTLGPAPTPTPLPSNWLSGVTPQDWSFAFNAYLYYASSTALRAIWTTQPSTNATVPTLWQQVYNQPDFAFNQPNRGSSNNPTFTPDIQVSGPLTPTAGTPLTITATVRNYSLVGFPNPANPGLPPLQATIGYTTTGGTSQVIATQTINAVAAQGTTTIQQVFTPPSAGCYAVWVTLDPNNQQPEVHKANNSGWNNVTVLAANGSGDDPCAVTARGLTKGTPRALALPGQAPDLAIRPGNVTVERVTGEPRDSRQAAAARNGRLLRITVPVHATGGHFSNVPVYLYDGDPRAGGTYIGHEVIPLIWAGFKSTARIEWDVSNVVGTREVYAQVRFTSDVERRHDNNMVRISVPIQPPLPTPTATPAPTRTPTPTQVAAPTRNPVEVGNLPNNRIAPPPPGTATPTPPARTPVPTPR